MIFFFVRKSFPTKIITKIDAGQISKSGSILLLLNKLKQMETLIEKSIGEIVAADYRTSDIFKNHGIDFCCGGKKSLSKVCAEKNIDVELLAKEL